MLRAGMILGGTYQIIEEIGSGGGGIVYRARHLRLQTDVVVKRIRDEVRGKIQSRQEADVLKNLKHPYLPRVYDFIETPEAVYTVMDFIPGISLDKALVQYGRFAPKQVLRWAQELGEALAYLHNQNPPIIHSDIKPANIIVTPDGHICLIDFNISIVIDSAMKATLGISAGYSSPEQYRDVQQIQTYYNTGGMSQVTITIDRRSDIYSLGCVLYHLLAGFPPGNNFNTRMSAEEIPGISEGLAFIIDKMIEYDSNDRYQNGQEYLMAINNCYKLDRRYIMHMRKEKALFVTSLVFFFIGSLLIGFGITQCGKEREQNYQALLLEGEEIAEKGNYEKAIDAMVLLEEEYKSRVEAYERELYYYYQAGHYQECADRGNDIIALQLIEITNDSQKETVGDIFYLIANSYYELEDYSKAEKAMENALEYNETNNLYFRDYCIILAKQGELFQAEDALKKAVELNLEDDSIHYAEGELCVVRKQIEEAIEHFKTTIEITDDEILQKRAVLLCATALRDNNRIDEEVQLLEMARNQIDNQAKMVITEYLADAYMRQGDAYPDLVVNYNQKALTLFQELMQNGYVTYQLQENMAILYEENKDFEMAKSVLLKLAGEYPGNYRVYKRLAFLEADRQQYYNNSQRNYSAMKEYYDKCKELYEEQDVEDSEVLMLDNMIRDLQTGGWL
ncbi:MAG: protein kinase [Alphaproteobacteria bacterium]|nr:protein kinase [Alphaproteobacteria bacterium]MBQ6787670.1 protein kinase [Lachnospiraceae bacterium]